MIFTYLQVEQEIQWKKGHWILGQRKELSNFRSGARIYILIKQVKLNWKSKRLVGKKRTNVNEYSELKVQCS